MNEHGYATAGCTEIDVRTVALLDFAGGKGNVCHTLPVTTQKRSGKRPERSLLHEL
jgi:hypothetical protein